MEEVRALNALEIMRKRRTPVTASWLAKLLGVSRFTVLNHIKAGIFPDGSVYRMGGFRIRADAARWYVESRVFDAKDPDGYFQEKFAEERESDRGGE